jgi:hypothetical protein
MLDELLQENWLFSVLFVVQQDNLCPTGALWTATTLNRVVSRCFHFSVLREVIRNADY